MWWIRQHPEASDLNPLCLAAATGVEKVIVLAAPENKQTNFQERYLVMALGYLPICIHYYGQQGEHFEVGRPQSSAHLFFNC